MILKLLLRLLFISLVAAFAVNAYSTITPREEWNQNIAALYASIAGVVALALVLFEWRFQKQITRELVASIFGFAAGLLVTALIILISVIFFLPSTGSDVYSSFNEAFARVQPIIPMILCACCYIGVTLVLHSRNDFRFLIPYIDFSAHGQQEGGILLDTSAIIDGRVVDICKTRLISVPVIIPDFVVRELQALADSADKTKRLRGRRGLDMVNDLKKTDSVRVVIRETQTPVGTPVDDELIRCAKEINGRIVTTDFNLNKVSQIEGLVVININDIANAVKSAVIPGEKLNLRIVRAGQEDGQGVGYLEDGTMVVVEGARGKIDQSIAVMVTGSIQTSAGRMVFGRLPENIEGGE